MTVARAWNFWTTVYLHTDHLGSPAAATDASANLQWREDYTPYGEARQMPWPNDDQSGFTGHIHDADTGLTYMQARYYDPVIGRFLSEDPVGFAQGGAGYFNRYAYVMNDPVNAWDATGEDTVKLSFDVDAVAYAGTGVSVGIYKEMHWRMPNAASLADGFMDYPFNPVGALLDAATDTTEVGVAIDFKGAAGFNTSVGLEGGYAMASPDELRGNSVTVEGGAGPFGAGYNTPIPSDMEMGNAPVPKMITGELAIAPPMPTADIAVEHSVLKPIIQRERNDFD